MNFLDRIGSNGGNHTHPISKSCCGYDVKFFGYLEYVVCLQSEEEVCLKEQCESIHWFTQTTRATHIHDKTSNNDSKERGWGMRRL